MSIFDEIIERKGTNCEKYDFAKKYIGSDDLIPMWVADMDFATPEFVLNTLKKRLKHPILGYTEPDDAFYQSIINWQHKRHNWQTQKKWYSFTPGIVTGLNLAIQAFSQKEDGIIVQSPVYYPFFNSVRKNNRKLLDNKLILNNKKYEIDFNDLEKHAKEAKILLLCNPQNPTGRVFTKDELSKIGDIAIKHNLIIISDEIHCDLVFKPNMHTPIASTSSEVSARTITLVAPSKTFNVAGLNTSLAIIENESLKKIFDLTCEKIHTGVPNIFGMIALQSAFEDGDAWLQELIEYLQKNVDIVDKYLKKELPQIKLIYPESTFLLWLDFSELKMNSKELKEFLLYKAKVGFSDGRIFGKNGIGFARMNIGTPKSVILQALDRIKNALCEVNK